MGRKKNIMELTRCSTADYREMEKLPLIVLADNVRSMHNIGSIFRTADSFLISEIILGGISGVPPHPEITKTALGAEESVSWRHVDDSLAELQKLKSEGWKVCVLEQAHGSIPVQDFHSGLRLPIAASETSGGIDTTGGSERGEESASKIVLVVGNEVSGVDQRIVDLADYILEIPQYGTKHSLNVSVSAGIALFSLIHNR